MPFVPCQPIGYTSLDLIYNNWAKVASILLNLRQYRSVLRKDDRFLTKTIGEQSLAEDFIQKLHVLQLVDTLRVIILFLYIYEKIKIAQIIILLHVDSPSD